MPLPLAHLRCPACRGPLAEGPAELRCARCAAGYPVVAGIPDLRICEDPYIGKEEDRRKARALESGGRDLTFAELVDHYFAITPEVAPELARRYRAHHLSGLDRGRALRRRVEGRFPGAAPTAERPLLDLGCGTAGLLAALGEGGLPPTALLGVDVALRWLVVARRRLEEEGCGEVPLLCACADHLPLASDSVGLVVAENLLEHVSEPAAVLREAHRVAAPGAPFMARTVNRFVLGPEPHVDLWGVGWLPRRWMNGYVRRRRGIAYEAIRLRSLPELRRLVRSLEGASLEVGAPRLENAEIAHLPALRRRLLRLYRGLGTALPPLRSALAFVGPFLDVTGTLGGRPAGDVDGG